MLKLATAFTAILLLSGCAYDYLQHTDRVAYSAGDAVHANLEAETVNPSSRAQYDVGGLGNYGDVISGSGYKGNCEYSDQHASNGSICGGRSAQARPGGVTPPPEGN